VVLSHTSRLTLDQVVVLKMSKNSLENPTLKLQFSTVVSGDLTIL
jgi:hypothetical protein